MHHIKTQKDGHYRIYAVTNSNLILLCSFREMKIHEILQLETPKTCLLFYAFFTKKNLFFDLSVSGNNSKYSFYKFSIPFLFSLKQCSWFECFVFPKTKQKRRKYSKILIDICLKLHLGRLRLLRIFFDKDKKNVYCTVCVYCTVRNR